MHITFLSYFFLFSSLFLLLWVKQQQKEDNKCAALHSISRRRRTKIIILIFKSWIWKHLNTYMTRYAMWKCWDDFQRIKRQRTWFETNIICITCAWWTKEKKQRTCKWTKKFEIEKNGKERKKSAHVLQVSEKKSLGPLSPFSSENLLKSLGEDSQNFHWNSTLWPSVFYSHYLVQWLFSIWRTYILI